MDVNLFQTVTVSRTDQNVTKGLTFGLNNATAFTSDVFQTMTGTRTDTSTPDPNTTETVNTTITFKVTGVGSYQVTEVQTGESGQTLANSKGVSSETPINFNGNSTDQMNQATQMAQILPTAVAFTATGLALSILALALVLMEGRTERLIGGYAYTFGILGALLLFLAPLITAGNVGSFWGSLQLPPLSYIWNNQAMMVWGAAIGWYVTFTASLLIFACSLMVRSEYLEKKRILATRSLK
jgi:hypothetical protein